jgi:DNA-binding MarR family transcriptional regulator
MRENQIEAILSHDRLIQQVLRNRWPESWLQIHLPLGATRALLAIDHLQARTPGRVAEILGISRTTVTGLLDRLEDQGLIRRAIDATDRRQFQLQLTPQGHELINEIEGARRQALAQALTTLSASDLAALDRGLAALAAAMMPPATAPTHPISVPEASATL